MSEFLLTGATAIKTAEELAEKRPVVRALERFERDLGMAGCTETFSEGSIRIEQQALRAEAWEISVQPQSVTIAAADELGVI